MRLKGLLRNFFAPYQVIIEFWADSGVITHIASNYSEALQWCSCYPNSVVANVNHRLLPGMRWKRVAMVGQR